MTKDEALKLALEALIGARAFLESDAPVEIWGVNDQAITAIKEALAQPEHIGFMDSKLNPIQRTWVGLTADEMEGLVHLATYMDVTDYIHMLMMAEDKLKEKNDG